uniref:NS1 protein n=1 Tax=Blue antimora parvovirus TaxID=3138853 RepID=A0AAU7LKE6_9VIRU
MATYTATLHLGAVSSQTALDTLTAPTGFYEAAYTSLEAIWRAQGGSGTFGIQIEQAGGIHLHIVFEHQGGVGLRPLGQAFRAWAQGHITNLRAILPQYNPPSNPFQPKRKRNGSWSPIDAVSFYERYLALKALVQQGGGNGYLFRQLNAEYANQLNAQRMGEEPGTGARGFTPRDRTGQGESEMTRKTSKAETYKYMVDKCTEDGIGTVMQLKEQYPELYWNNAYKRGGDGWLAGMIEHAKKNMVSEHSLADYTSNEELQGDWPLNVITRTVRANGYPVDQFCRAMYLWSAKATGKKNTLVFFGPPNTGKTMIASSIVLSSPWHAMVNKNNENFPFTACGSSMLIWWEEGRIKESMVEEAKCILGGTEVLVDKKCSPTQVQVPHTPVLMTTNHNPTTVHGTNSTTTEHEEALSARMIMYGLDEPLPTNDWFTYPDKQEAVCAWSQVVSFGKSLSGLEVNLTYPMAKGKTLTPGCLWGIEPDATEEQELRTTQQRQQGAEAAEDDNGQRGGDRRDGDILKGGPVRRPFTG